MIKFIFSNFWTKIMALILAVLVWGYLYTESTESNEQDVSFFAEGIKQIPDIALLRILDEANTTILTYNMNQEATEKIKVRITGSKGTIRSLVKKGIECRLRLEPKKFVEKSSGSFTINISRDDFNLPGDIQVKVLPSEELRVEYTKFEIRDMKINVSKEDLEGAPADGFELVDVQPHPSKIRIKIPADKKMDRVRIEKIKIEGRVETFSLKPPLQRLEFPVFPVDDFEVRVNIQPVHLSKQFDDLSFSLSLPQNVQPFKITMLEPKTLKLNLRGPKRIVDRINKDDIQITVRCSRAPTDKEPVINANLQLFSVEISGVSQSDLALLQYSISPNEVQIKIEKSK